LSEWISSDPGLGHDYFTGAAHNNKIVDLFVREARSFVDAGMELTVVFDPATAEHAVPHKAPTDEERRE